MTFGFGGPIVGRAIVKALGRDQETTAMAHDANASRAALDEDELRELERAEYYGDAPARPEPTQAPPHRSLIDRLLGR